VKANRERFLLFRIRAFQDGDAFAHFVKEYGPRVQKFLDFKLPTFEDSKDAMAETWIRVWTYAQTTPIESFSGVVHTIARGVVSDFYRRRGRHPEVRLNTDEHPEHEVSEPLHESMIDKIDSGLLQEAMGTLPEEESQIILMRYIEGYRVKDIAKEFGKAENAISVVLHRAVKKLRKSLKEKFDDV
jgi:RNA polymerase sigma-70 factor (ECF subfamily)